MYNISFNPGFIKPDLLCASSVPSVLAKEYNDVLSWISPVVEEHMSTLVAGIPQLNMCDVAVMVRFTGLLKLFFPSPASVSRSCVVFFWPAA